MWLTEVWNSLKMLCFLSQVIAPVPVSGLISINGMPWLIYERVWIHDRPSTEVYLECYQEHTPFLEKWEDAAEFGER